MPNRLTTGFQVWTIFIVCGVTSAVAIWGSQEGNTGTVTSTCVFIFAFFGWALVIPHLCNDVKLQWEIGNKCIAGIRQAFLSQETVDNKLRQLVKEHDDLLQMKVKSKNVESALIELHELKNQLETLKSTFWETHRIAANLKFKTKKRFNDYKLKR